MLISLEFNLCIYRQGNGEQDGEGKKLKGEDGEEQLAAEALQRTMMEQRERNKIEFGGDGEQVSKLGTSTLTFRAPFKYSMTFPAPFIQGKEAVRRNATRTILPYSHQRFAIRIFYRISASSTRNLGRTARSRVVTRSGYGESEEASLAQESA